MIVNQNAESESTSNAELKKKKPKNKSETLKKYYLVNRTKTLEYQRFYRIENRERISARNRLFKQTRQDEAIKYLGGKCKHCEGVFPSIVYDFHHVDPKEKEFMLSEHWSDSKEKVWAELDKCILLCANCHRLQHKKEQEG